MPAAQPASGPLDDDDEDDDIAYVSLRFDENEFSCSDYRDPEYFTHEVTGSIVLAGSGGELRESIGRFRVLQVDAEGAIAQGVSVYQVFDCSSSTFPYYEALFDRGSNVAMRVLKVLDCEDEYVHPSLLILDRLEISPRFRGKEYGLESLQALIQRFRMGAGLVVLKPFPLQFESDSLDCTAGELAARGLDQFKLSERAATAKLSKYYARLGFKKIPRTPYMAVSTVYPLKPAVAEFR